MSLFMLTICCCPCTSDVHASGDMHKTGKLDNHLDLFCWVSVLLSFAAAIYRAATRFSIPFVGWRAFFERQLSF